MRSKRRSTRKSLTKIYEKERNKQMSEEEKNKIDEAVSIWDSEDVKAVEQAGGGSGWIVEAEFTFGYKVFAAGKTNEESFFKFDVSNKAEREEARKKASDFAQAVNERTPTTALAIIMPKDKVYLRDTSKWRGDNWWVVPTYTKGYEEILKPSLKGTDSSLGKQWVRIGFKADPYKPKRMSKNQLTGEDVEVANLIPYVIERFADVNAAMAAVEGAMLSDKKTVSTSTLQPAANTNSGEYPDGWDAESWSFAIGDIKEQSKSGKSPAEIAKAYEISVAFVMKALGS